MFFIGDQIEYKEISNDVKRKMLANGGSLMVLQYDMKKGAKVPMHEHVHEQAGYILSGEFEILNDTEGKVLKAGDSYYAQSNQKHGLVCIKDGVFLDIFTPQREDFKK